MANIVSITNHLCGFRTRREAEDFIDAHYPGQPFTLICIQARPDGSEPMSRDEAVAASDAAADLAWAAVHAGVLPEILEPRPAHSGTEGGFPTEEMTQNIQSSQPPPLNRPPHDDMDAFRKLRKDREGAKRAAGPPSGPGAFADDEMIRKFLTDPPHIGDEAHRCIRAALFAARRTGEDVDDTFARIVHAAND